jgi:hypothetical protein
MCGLEVRPRTIRDDHASPPRAGLGRGHPIAPFVLLRSRYSVTVRTSHVLIGFETLKAKWLSPLAAEHFRVHLFLSPYHTKVPTELALAIPFRRCECEQGT